MKGCVIPILGLALLLAAAPAAAQLQHRVQAGVGGRQHQFLASHQGTRDILMIDTQLGYALSGGTENLQGLLDVQVHVVHSRVKSSTGQLVATDTGLEVAIFGGLRHEWVELAVGLHASTLDSSTLGTFTAPAFVGGRLRLFPERYVFAIGRFLDGPSEVQNGVAQLGLGTRAVPRTLLDVSAGFMGPGDDPGVSVIPRVEVDVWQGLTVGAWASVSTAHLERSGAGGSVGYGL